MPRFVISAFDKLRRYSSYHERSFARWYDRPFDFVALNKAAIPQVIPPEHQQALVIDTSFIPKSGTHTYGLDHFWNSRHQRSEKGLEVSAVAWLDVTGNCAYGLSVEQTPPSDKSAAPQSTRIDAYLEQLRDVVLGHQLHHLRYVIADGYYSKRKFLDGVRALGLHHIGKLRRDANLRYLYQGPRRPGPGRPKNYDGKVHLNDRSRFEQLPSEDDTIVLYHQVLNHVHLRRNLRVVLVVDTRSRRQAVLFSTDTEMDAQTLYRSYKARFQIEFLFRDAKQFTSLSAFQARSQAKLHVHFNASMSALTLGKLEAQQQSHGAQTGFSMASVKRRAFNQHLLSLSKDERISQHLAQGRSLEKSSPGYEALCDYGTITDMAA